MRLYISSIGRYIHLHPRYQLRRQRSYRVAVRPRAVTDTAPPTWSYRKGCQFPIDNNDTEGDCEVAATFHSVELSTRANGSPTVFTTPQAHTLYRSLTGGGDTGLATDTMMASWKAGLGGLGHSILDDMAISPTDRVTASLCGYRFGGIFFTLGIPDQWLKGPSPGFVWDAGAGIRPDENNGHAVLFSGVSSLGYDTETWGFQPCGTVTFAGVGACDPEMTVVFSRDWYNKDGVSPAGYHYEDDAKLWTALGGNSLPPWGGPTPPVPTPVSDLGAFRLPRGAPARSRVTFVVGAKALPPATYGYHAVAGEAKDATVRGKGRAKRS